MATTLKKPGYRYFHYIQLEKKNWKRKGKKQEMGKKIQFRTTERF